MNKRVTIPMETTAYYQSESKLNVRFWNQDRNTAELQFLITRNNFPLSLSGENVKVILTLESGESFITTDDLDIENEVEGVATYIIPEEFMAVATEVVGQIYVATIDGDEIVVQRRFTFTVENDLLSSIPSEEKLRYIKMFSDLQEEMSTRLGGVETALTQLEANVDAVNNARQNGITAINNLYDAKLVTFNQNYDDKIALINNSMSDIENYVDTSLADMTQKKSDFDASVTGSGLVTTGESKDWQKYKLTVDDGSYQTIDIKGELSTYQNLAPGLYYTSNAPISGMGQSSAAGWTIVEQRQNYSNLKRITFRPYNSNQEFVMRYYNEWGSWENKFDGLEKSIDAQSKANVAENNAKLYTDEKISALHKVLFTGSVNGVDNNVVLNDDYNNFDEVRLFYSTLGGRDSKVVKAKETNQILIHSFNLTNSDGSNGDIFETTIDRVNGTTLKISNEVRFNLLNQTGGSTSGITITEIIGVKY